MTVGKKINWCNRSTGRSTARCLLHTPVQIPYYCPDACVSHKLQRAQQEWHFAVVPLYGNTASVNPRN